MRGSSLIAVIFIILFLLVLFGAILGACGPTYRYAYGSNYGGGFFYWGTMGYGPGSGTGRFIGGRGVGGRFRGGGTGFGK